MMLAELDTVLDYAQGVSIRVIAPSDLVEVLNDLTDLLVETVNTGNPMGFMSPIDEDIARDYWISLLPELRSGRVLLFVAMSEGSVVGTAQLVPSRRGNSPHRAQVEKVFVDRLVRGRGVGTALMKAIEELALHYRRRLLILSTRVGEPAHDWYRSLGYKDVGVIPGWTIGPDGERYDHVEMYKELVATRES
ncbi:MAG TPA: GNAT family N-acetyltransferase [Gemmatimonadaceae bacterium]|nr:GNAT family N-acetyltransferase [Gemmatimonadaceae bacterium]